MRRPDGMLGFMWGDNSEEVIIQLGVSGGFWNPWLGGQGFEIYSGSETVISFLGRQCRICLVRHATNLAGMQFIFDDCFGHQTELINKVRNAFDLERSDSEPYHVWRTGELVRFSQNQEQGKCVLTVAGPIFGTAFQANLLTSGIRDTLNGLKPH